MAEPLIPWFCYARRTSRPRRCSSACAWSASPGAAGLTARLDAFLHAHDRGYFVIEAPAGLGKTAYLAHLVSERAYVHHFPLERLLAAAIYTRGLVMFVTPKSWGTAQVEFTVTD